MTSIEKERKRAKQAMANFRARRGDFRTDEEIRADNYRRSHYTQEEADKLIKEIQDAKFFYVRAEHTDGTPVDVAKEDMIAQIRARIIPERLVK